MGIKSYKIGERGEPKFGSNYSVIKQVVLNCTNINGNNNKFYSIELQKCKGVFRIFTHYGRVGVSGVKEGRYISKGDIKPKKGKTLEECVLESASKEYERLLKAKKKKGYHVVDVEAADVGSGKAKVQLSIKRDTKGSSLDERVSGLVEQIYDEASSSLTSALRTPLGSLSLHQIEKGYDKLEEIRTALSSKKNLDQLSSEFYSLIPQRFPGRIDKDSVIIDNSDKADRKEELLQLMRDVYEVKGSLGSEVDAKYKAMNALINPIDNSSRDYKRIVKKILKTQSRHHYVDIHVNKIYKVELNATKGRFNPNTLKVMELFHGSATRNLLGILQRGLLISPPDATYTGSAFGRGIYFAKHSTKSSQYCTRFYRNKYSNGFLFLADVAVGKMQKVYTYDGRIRGPARGFDSIKGVKGPVLLHDEHIIYNANQSEIRYIVDFNPKNKR